MCSSALVRDVIDFSSFLRTGMNGDLTHYPLHSILLIWHLVVSALLEGFRGS